MSLNHAIRARSLRAKVAALSAVALLGLAAFASSAQALGTCPYTGAEQVFKPWGDSHHYVLAPNGGFEAGAERWSLRNGASVVAGNESFYLNDASDSRSLSLPPRSSAVSSPICMSIDTPIVRLLASNTGDPSSRLRVEAVYPLLGLIRTRTFSNVVGGADWAPTGQLSTVLTLSTIVGTLVPSSIQIRIRPLDDDGEWRVDDLYVDPFARR